MTAIDQFVRAVEGGDLAAVPALADWLIENGVARRGELMRMRFRRWQSERGRLEFEARSRRAAWEEFVGRRAWPLRAAGAAVDELLDEGDRSRLDAALVRYVRMVA